MIIEQHAEEVAFNWILRNGAVSEPHYDLSDLAHLDGSVEANLDGLRIAGADGWEICQAAMALEEAGEIFTAGVMAFESLDPDRMDSMLAAVEMETDLQRALVSALGWIDFDRIAEPARRLMEADLPFLRLIGLGAFGVHRQPPGPLLARLVQDPDETVRARALKAVGELGRSELLALLADHLKDEDAKCRFYAAWSATLLNDPSGLRALQALAESASPYAAEACLIAVRSLPIQDAARWLERIWRQPHKRHQRMAAMGAMGDPAGIPFLLEQMHIPDLARPAGEAFSMITGVDLAFDDLETDAPEGFAAGPTEDPADENVAMDPDEDLPWPAPDLIEAWWAANKGQFTAGTRYFLGRPMTDEALQAALKTAYQRQRIAAAMELAIRHPGRPLFAWRAPGYRQKKSSVWGRGLPDRTSRPMEPLSRP